MKFQRIYIGLFILGLIASACASAQPAENQQPQVTEASPTSTPEVVSIWLPPYLPKQLTKDLEYPKGALRATNEQSASIRIDVGSDALISKWIYVLVAPFSTTTDEISLNDLRSFWQGNEVNRLSIEKILVDGGTKALFEKLWGTASVAHVTVTAGEELMATAWAAKNTWAIVPFESLEPRWKVIRVDGQSPIRKNFDLPKYPLTIPFSVVGNPTDVSRFLDVSEASINPLFPSTNRDEQKLATVMLTGVTAMVRATAYLMEKNGMTYPAIDIGELLRSADILHVSNEIPFTSTCPNPFYNKINEDNLVFCSKPKYIQLLEAVGTDVVELTGDHFRDWGPEAMLNTIAMYDERGWQYYGGGKNLEDAMSPALYEINGNKIAFLGCNAKPPGYATAKADYPGALHCDMEAMANEIADVVKKGYQPIFTFQHLEYYAYNINSNLVSDFHKAAEAGAVVISGSQAHQPHAFEFYKGSLLHYGLGNLFFDQYKESTAQRQAFIDEHIFYDGRYISTELITIQFIDNARSRISTAVERKGLLEKVFSVSKW
jgi:poly-gamma-glutamate synthesis protein (capsule biosynthesis protein)